MRRILLVLGALLIFATGAVAQELSAPKKVAVFDFDSEESMASDSIILSKRFLESLSAEVGFEPLPRATVKKEIASCTEEETDFYEDTETAVRIAAALGADIAVVGQVLKVNKTFVLRIRLIEVSSTKVLSEHTAQHTGVVLDALGLADILVMRIIGTYDNPEIVTDLFPEGRVGVPYSAGLELSPAVEDIKWSSVDGTLPDGLRVEGDRITGIPKKPGLFLFTIRAGVKAVKLRGGVEKILEMRIKPAPLTLPDMELPVGRLGHRYCVEVIPPTGTPPFEWRLLDGLLPSGVIFNSTTGEVEGVPAVTGESRIKVEVTDSLVPPETVEGWLSMRVTHPMRILTIRLPAGYNGCKYVAKLKVENGLAPFKVEVVGSTGGFELEGSREDLEVGGNVTPTASHGRVTLRVSDSTTPEPQAIDKTYPLRVNGFHVTPVFSYDSIELYDIATDRAGNAMILTAMNVLSRQSRWIAFSRWSGRDWTVLPVTAEIEGADYKLLSPPDGPPLVAAYSKVGNSPQMVLSLFRPSEKEWIAETVGAGKYHFLKIRFRPDGTPVFGFERDGKLWFTEKKNGGWSETVFVDGVTELIELVFAPSGKVYAIYLDEAGLPVLLEKENESSRTLEIPDYPRCAGLDPDGNLRVFSYSVGESVCYLLEDGVFKDIGHWNRSVTIGSVFSKQDIAAYSTAVRTDSGGTPKPAISCVSPLCFFDKITFDESMLRASSYDTESLRLSVDRHGNLHAAFTATGVPGRQKKTLVYGQIATKEEFQKVAGAKSFVRLTSQRELAMPKQMPGRVEKTGSCIVAPDGSYFSLLPFLFMIPLYLIRRRLSAG